MLYLTPCLRPGSLASASAANQVSSAYISRLGSRVAFWWSAIRRTWNADDGLLCLRSIAIASLASSPSSPRVKGGVLLQYHVATSSPFPAANSHVLRSNGRTTRARATCSADQSSILSRLTQSQPCF